MQAKPFLKWAGGKTQLIDILNQTFPRELKAGKIKSYIEPFVGAGAVFFYIAQNYSIDKFLIGDINPELILTYKIIKNDVGSLISYLSELQSQYLLLDTEERKIFYYKIRSDFNKERAGFDFEAFNDSCIKRGAQVIFLNRTCFNGLFRVNSKGEFNVPVGRYKNPKICDAENLKRVAEVLQKANIYLGDYKTCEPFVNQQSFVYFDPPYRPISKTSNFNSYAKAEFIDSQQLELRDFFLQLDKKGAKVLLSNSDPKNEDKNDSFFETAYESFNIKVVKASRNINSNASKRGRINELLISNY